MVTKIGMVKNFSKLQKLWQNRRRANGLRVLCFPRIQNVADQWRSQKFTVEKKVRHQRISQEESYSCRCSTTFPLHQKTMKKMSVECQTRFSVSKEIWKRRMVIHWSWFWKEVVVYQWRQSTRIMGQYSRKDAVGIRRKSMSKFPCDKSIV